MGYERLSMRSVSAISPAPTTLHNEVPAPVLPTNDIAVSPGTADVLQQARQMRDEWRRERYSRLKG